MFAFSLLPIFEARKYLIAISISDWLKVLYASTLNVIFLAPSLTTFETFGGFIFHHISKGTSMSIIRFQDLAVRETDDRLIELKLENRTFLLYPGTAQGLAGKLTEAQKELFSDKQKPA